MRTDCGTNVDAPHKADAAGSRSPLEVASARLEILWIFLGFATGFAVIQDLYRSVATVFAIAGGLLLTMTLHLANRAPTYEQVHVVFVLGISSCLALASASYDKFEDRPAAALAFAWAIILIWKLWGTIGLRGGVRRALAADLVLVLVWMLLASPLASVFWPGMMLLQVEVRPVGTWGAVPISVLALWCLLGENGLRGSAAEASRWGAGGAGRWAGASLIGALAGFLLDSEFRRPLIGALYVLSMGLPFVGCTTDRLRFAPFWLRSLLAGVLGGFLSAVTVSSFSRTDLSMSNLILYAAKTEVMVGLALGLTLPVAVSLSAKITRERTSGAKA